MLKRGDVREDGYVFDGHQYYSPEVYAGLSAYQAKYHRDNYERSVSKATPADAGQAGEYLVAADLLHRQLLTTKPLNTNGPHDLHFRANSGVWLTVQVKCGTRNKKTGALLRSGSRQTWTRVKSDVLAIVFLPTKQIRYYARPGTELPPELEDHDAD